MKKRGTFYHIVVVVVFLFLSVLVLPVSAQDTTDPFDELEEELFIKKENQKPASLLDQLKKNISGSLVLQSMHFLNSKPMYETGDPTRNFINSSLDFEEYIRLKKIKLFVSGWLQAGNQRDTFEGSTDRWQDPEYQQNHFLEINEVFLQINLKRMDLSFGRQLLKNGISTLYSPADRFSAPAAYDPIQFRKLASWQVRMDATIRGTTLTALLLPIYEIEKIPNLNSRWGVSFIDFEGFTFDPEFAHLVHYDCPKVSTKNFAYFGRIKRSYNQVDWFISSYYGPDRYHVLALEGYQVQIKSADVSYSAAGFASALGQFQLHGEVGYNGAMNREDDSYATSVLGVDFYMEPVLDVLAIERIEMSMDYAKEFETKQQRAPGFITSSRKSRFGRNDLFTRFLFRLKRDWRFEYNSHYRFSERCYLNRIHINKWLKGRFNYGLMVDFFGGTKTAFPYGRWRNQSRAIFSMRYKF